MGKVIIQQKVIHSLHRDRKLQKVTVKEAGYLSKLRISRIFFQLQHNFSIGPGLLVIWATL